MTERRNRIRAFTEVVSLDAWHDDFDKVDGRASVFADVVFRTARVGGEADCPIRFKLRLKRAEIHLIIPDSEPLRIDPASVARTPIRDAMKRSITTEDSRQLTQRLEADAKLALGSSKATKIAASASSKQGEQVQTKETVQVVSEELLLQVSCTISPEGNYRWDVDSFDHTPLKGTPWDAREPRATLIDEGGQSRNGLAPGGVRFEARCTREDMIIEEIEIKDPNLWDRLKHGAFPKTKEMVVEQYIREELIKEGLEAQNIEDKYGLVTLSAVVATE